MSGFLFAEMKQINTIFVSAPSFIFKQTFLSSVFLLLNFSCPSSCFKSCNVISYFEIQQNLSCNGNSSVVLKFRRPGPLVFQLCKTEKFLRKKSCVKVVVWRKWRIFWGKTSGNPVVAIHETMGQTLGCRDIGVQRDKIIWSMLTNTCFEK